MDSQAETYSAVDESIKDRPHTISPEEYPMEVKRCIVELRHQRQRIFEELGKIDIERKSLQNDIRILTDRLAKISIEQAQKMQCKLDLESTIEETESAYTKLIEASKGLYKSVNETKKSMQDTEFQSTSEFHNIGTGFGHGKHLHDMKTDSSFTPPSVPFIPSNSKTQ